MVKKKEENIIPVASTLTMPKQQVVDLIRKQIELSEVLLQYQVPFRQVMRDYDMFGGGGHAEKEYDKNTAIVVGNERFGINSKWYDNKNSKVFIPMKSGINSINVGVAASIIMFDAGIKKRKI